jgi:hypothetical protein
MPKAAKKTIAGTETKPKKPREPREVVEVVYALDVPEGATHFRMRRDGRQGLPCLFMRNGVEIEQIPIRWFTSDNIRDRWGYCPDYWVTFNRLDEKGHRNPLGGWKRLRFPDPRTRKGPPPPEMHETAAERAPDDEPDISALSAPSASDPWAAMMTIRQMVASDSRDALAAERSRADTVLAAERERSRENTSMLLRMFELSMAQANRTAEQVRPAPRSEEEESAVVRLLRADLARERERIDRLLEERDTDDDDEDEGTQAEQLARFGKLAKKEGAIAAFMSFAEEKTVASMFQLLPEIQSKLPQYWREVQPFLKDLLGAPAPAPPPAPPVPPPQAPTASMGPPPGRANGTVPKRPRVAKDDLTPEVG